MRITLIGFVLLLGSTVTAVWMESQNSKQNNSNQKISRSAVSKKTNDLETDANKVQSNKVSQAENSAEVASNNTPEPIAPETSALVVTDDSKEIVSEPKSAKVEENKKKKAKKKKSSALEKVVSTILPSAAASDQVASNDSNKQANLETNKEEKKSSISKDNKIASNEAPESNPEETSEEMTDEVSTQDAAPQLTGNLANLAGGGGRKKLTGNVEFGASTDLKPFTDQTKASLSSVFIRPRYQLTRNYAVQGTIWFDKGLTGGQENLVRDTRVGIAKTPTKLGKGLLLAPNITATLPTSEFSRRNLRLNAGLEFNPTIIYQPNSLTTVFYTPRMRANFHEFTTTETDRVNTQYQFTQLAGVSYSLSNKWTITPIILFTERWSYEGTQIDPTYLTILEMRYQIDRQKYVSFGTLTGGALYDAEVGPDQTIEVFEENSTNIYANVGILF